MKKAVIFSIGCAVPFSQASIFAEDQPNRNNGEKECLALPAGKVDQERMGEVFEAGKAVGLAMQDLSMPVGRFKELNRVFETKIAVAYTKKHNRSEFRFLTFETIAQADAAFFAIMASDKMRDGAAEYFRKAEDLYSGKDEFNCEFKKQVPPLSSAGQQKKAWDREPDTYRGVKIGSSEKEVKEVLGKKTLNCFDTARYASSAMGERECTGSLTVGDARVSEYWGFKKDRLVAVIWNFEPKNYPPLKVTFLEKYGDPTSKETVPVKTRMGVEYQQETLSWYGSRFAISISNLGSRVDEANASFLDVNELTAQLKAKAEAQKTAKDAF
jgi:hypothetical protein